MNENTVNEIKEEAIENIDLTGLTEPKVDEIGIENLGKYLGIGGVVLGVGVLISIAVKNKDTIKSLFKRNKDTESEEYDDFDEGYDETEESVEE